MAATKTIKTFNSSGFKPAYRRLTMDMSKTLSRVLDYPAAIPGAMHVVDIRGQVNSAFLPAQASDFMHWLLAVCPYWTVMSQSSANKSSVSTHESFNVSTYLESFSRSSFVKELVLLLCRGNISLLMKSEPSKGGDGNLLKVMFLDRSSETLLEFCTVYPVESICDYVLTDNSLVTLDETQAVAFDPYQVAAVTRQLMKTQGEPRALRNITFQCGMLVGKNNAVVNAVALSQAVENITNVITANLAEYGFHIKAQLRLAQSVINSIYDAFLDRYTIVSDQNTNISVTFYFIDTDLTGDTVAPWSQCNVTLTPVLRTPEVVINPFDLV